MTKNMGTANSLISIIIPSYNSSHLLDDSIGSCLKQTYTPIEIIVVNDGSDDETDLTMKSYLKKVSYVKQANEGVARARNRGVEISNGKWLLFLDADDVLYPNALSNLANEITTEDHGVIFGITRQYRDGKMVSRYNKVIEGKPPRPAKGNFFKSLIVTPGAAIVKRKIFDMVGGFKQALVPSEDRNFWLKCGTLTSFKASDEDVVLKRQQESSASNDKNRMAFKGFLTQVDFLTWCYENSIDSSFVPWNETQIYEMNLKQALRDRKWAAFQAILLHARFSKISSKEIKRYKKIGHIAPVMEAVSNATIWLSGFKKKKAVQTHIS